MQIRDVDVLALVAGIYISASLHLHIIILILASFTHIILLDTT